MDVYGADDFGPETDVDVVDDAMLSPALTLVKDNNMSIDFNSKTDLITNNETLLLDNNHHNNIKNELIKDHDLNEASNDFHLNNHNNHHIDDNKVLEATGGIADDDEHKELNSNNELNHTKKDIDFSEKREYSFECEEYEKELNTLSDATVELMSTVSDAFSDQLATPVLATEMEPIEVCLLSEAEQGECF